MWSLSPWWPAHHATASAVHGQPSWLDCSKSLGRDLQPIPILIRQQSTQSCLIVHLNTCMLKVDVTALTSSRSWTFLLFLNFSLFFLIILINRLIVLVFFNWTNYRFLLHSDHVIIVHAINHDFFLLLVWYFILFFCFFYFCSYMKPVSRMILWS